MHRKFIAFIVTTAILVTGFSAAPARAGDAEKLLGGLAALAILVAVTSLPPFIQVVRDKESNAKAPLI